IPRQIGTAGRKGRHDLREFVDAGAFALEFVYEYLCFTGDEDILNETVQWLGDGQKSSVWEHCLRILSYYTDPENIGKHGLCKIRGGDWLDAVNNAGLKGRGESVMVTAQVILAIDYVQEIAASYALSIPDPQKISDARDQFEAALNREAYNPSGFYSGVFTDNGEWLFSHKDPDGECRPYICANAYAIVCGTADTRQRESILEHFGRLKSESGYRLFAPALGRKPVSCAGRLGSGDAFGGLFENASPYNHGSHGFLGRSFSVMGRGEELYETLQYLLPFDQQKHNTVQAMTPPYAIVNCWQDIPLFKGRGGMTFLTGSIAMAIRLTYQWMFGIRPGLEGLILDPCLSESMTGAEVSFSIRNKKILLHISGQEDSRVRINGMPYSHEKYLKRERRNAVFIPYEVLEPENEIWV
ncbi:MAG: GH36-type glycosyl hydrolase domain-containing protein, partial [Blautia coccoides]